MKFGSSGFMLKNNRICKFVLTKAMRIKKKKRIIIEIFALLECYASIDWFLVSDVSVRTIGNIFMGQAGHDVPQRGVKTTSNSRLTD